MTKGLLENIIELMIRRAIMDILCHSAEAPMKFSAKASLRVVIADLARTHIIGELDIVSEVAGFYE